MCVLSLGHYIVKVSLILSMLLSTMSNLLSVRFMVGLKSSSCIWIRDDWSLSVFADYRKKLTARIFQKASPTNGEQRNSNQLDFQTDIVTMQGYKVWPSLLWGWESRSCQWAKSRWWKCRCLVSTGDSNWRWVPCVAGEFSNFIHAITGNQSVFWSSTFANDSQNNYAQDAQSPRSVQCTLG